MSRIFYIITEKELPFKIVAHSRLADFSLRDSTKYIKDAKPECKYYSCSPHVLTLFKDQYDDYLEDFPFPYGGYVYEFKYFSWLVHECNKLGAFRFIRTWEGDNICDDYCETFFSKCKNVKIDFNIFKTYFESEYRFENNIVEDVLFIVD